MNRLRDDTGKSVTIIGLSFVILTLLIGVLIVDFAKALYMKNLYTSFAIKSTQTAIKEQDTLGGLKPQSANKLLKEYLTQRQGGVNTADTQTNSSVCNQNGEYPKVKITYDTERAKGSKSRVYTSHGGQINIPDSHSFYKNQYKTIEAEIIDVSDNTFYSIFGVPCTEIHVNASGIATSTYDEEGID